MANIRIKDLTTTASLPAADDFLELDGATNGGRKLSWSTLASMFNLRPPRPGVYFDGTASSRITSTLGTAGAIAGDPFSFTVKFQVPKSNPSGDQGIIWVGSSATRGDQAYSFQVLLVSTGVLRVVIRGASSSDYRLKDGTTNLVTAYGGRTVDMVVTRSAGGPAVWINGVSFTLGSDVTNAGAPAWTDAITSTYFGLGVGTATTEVYVGAIYSATLYNLALSQTDAEEIYFNGGRVPFRYQWGSQVNRVFNPSAEVDTSNVSTEANTETHALTRNTSSPIAGAGDFKLAVTVAGGNTSYPRVNFATTSGNKDGLFYRVTFKTKVNSGTCAMANVRLTGVGGGGASPTNWAGSFTLSGSQTHEFLFSPADVGANDNALQIQFDGTATFDVQIDDVVLIQRGAVAHYALDEGIGYQLHDASTNKLDAIMTTTGVHHLIAKREGYVRTPGSGISWAGSHEPKNILGAASPQRMLPNEAVISQIVLKATVASTNGASVNSTNTAARWSAVAALSTTKSLRTIANSGLPAGTADADTDILIDPDTVNYTGTIQADVRYTIAEG